MADYVMGTGPRGGRPLPEGASVGFYVIVRLSMRDIRGWVQEEEDMAVYPVTAGTLVAALGSPDYESGV